MKSLKMDAIPNNVRGVDEGRGDSAAVEDTGGSKQLQFLPEVVLEMIIKELEDPKDFWSLLEAFPLIGQVVKINKSCKLLFDKVFPVLFKDLDKKDVLNCREVCRWWKKSTDNFVEDHPSQHPYDSKTFSEVETGYRYADLKSKYMKAKVICSSDGFPEKIRYIQEKRELGFKTPSFLGKSVRFLPEMRDANPDIMTEQLMTNYYKGLENFLKEFALEIRQASIPFTPQKHYLYAVVDHYEGFQRCLQLLSHVKSLTLDFPIPPFGIAYRWNHDHCSTTAMAREKLTNYMSVFPLPDMPNLETLSLTSMFRIEAIEGIFVALLKKFSGQVRRLSVDMQILRRECDLDFENLVELELLNCENWNHITFKEWIAGLKILRVEKLTLKTRFYSRISTPVLRDAFEACEVLPVKVLNIERLSFAHDLDPNFFPSPTENLPILENVTAFILRHVHISNANSFCFLKSLPLLEYLEVEIFNSRQEIIDSFLIDSDGLKVGPNGEKMVVWELLPKLKMFVVGEKRLPREIYYKK